MAIFVLDISNSQLLFNERVAEELAAAGHDVTMILMTPQPDRDNTDIRINSGIKGNEKSLEIFEEPAIRFLVHVLKATVKISRKEMEDKEEEFIYEEVPGWKMIERIRMQTTLLVETCRATLEQPKFLKWLEKEHFDVAFAPMFDVCTVGLVHAANIPGWIWLNSGSVMDYIAYLTGIPVIPSYVPPMMMEAAGELNFMQRVKSMIGHGLTKLIWTRLVAVPQTQLFRTLISPGFPDLQDLAAKCPLIMANTNDLYEMPRPTLAKVVNIGGVGMASAVKPIPEKLPEHIAKIMDKGDGAILFSFGSVAPAYKMPMRWKKIFLDTFKRFPNYQFLLRYEKDDIKDMLPPNVHLFTWMPQTDMLSHPNVRAFITHGGYSSFQEAVIAGVPLITIPLFGDQSKNARLAEHHGFSLVLLKGELSVDTVSNALEEVTTNPRSMETAQRLSRMLKLQPVKPAELLVGWSEFVAEFHTLENLEPAGIKLNFFQYYSLDVMALLLFVLFVLLLILVVATKLLKCLLTRVLSLVFRPKKQKKA
ncbi:UDP-glucoronosyl and UDP-glucosyl transferase [Ancylostoma duodenale]|uniref:UDP-glucuronosyltransferase n=1 Tax=Ancylostoma duodenale TaxID=51022 RepID=A0A0C2H5D0_9BILA|nr:UDP-glucoronosyl and UDP-glucosyl transferase [Ancylostoma duodenale]